MTMKQEIGLVFFAGLLGALVHSFAFFYADELGLTRYLELNIALDFDKDLLYQKMIWGGLWGLAYLVVEIISFWPRKYQFINVVLVSLAPSAFTLFYLFPEAGKGMLGQNIGEYMFVFVLIMNFIWAISTYIFGKVLGLFK